MRYVGRVTLVGEILNAYRIWKPERKEFVEKRNRREVDIKTGSKNGMQGYGLIGAEVQCWAFTNTRMKPLCAIYWLIVAQEGLSSLEFAVDVTYFCGLFTEAVSI
jgi:hypothetical protein